MSTKWFNQLQEEIGMAPKNSTQSAGVFSLLKKRSDILEYTPQKHPDVIETELSDRNGTYYVLKQSKYKRYLRLSPEQFSLWEKMDGQYNVQSLIVEHYMESGTFAHSMVVRLIQMLHHERMLADQPVRIWSTIRQAIASRSWSSRIVRPASNLITMRFGIKGIDHYVELLYKIIGWVFFTKPVQIFFLLLSLAGLYGVGRIINDPSYQFIGQQWLSSLALIWLASLLPVLIHELGHALTVKHYKREVPEGGLMLYIGMPAAYVNTTDMWLEGRKGRIAVTWNGPYTGLIIGGICALYIIAYPNTTTASFLFKMMGIAYLTVFMNVNPLLKFDGYYLLSDALEIPNLRERSMDFIRTRLFSKISKREKFNRDERIFTVYGLLSVVWLLYAFYLMGSFWQTRIRGGLQVLLGEGYSLFARVFSGLVVAALLSLSILLGIQLLRFLQSLANRYVRSGGLQAHRKFAVHLGIMAVISTWLIQRIIPSQPVDWQSFAAALFLLYSCFLLFRFNISYLGSARGWAHTALFLALLAELIRSLSGFFPLITINKQVLDFTTTIILSISAILFIHRPFTRLTIKDWGVGLVTGVVVYFGLGYIFPSDGALIQVGILTALGYLSISSVRGSSRNPALSLFFIAGMISIFPLGLIFSSLRTDILTAMLFFAGTIHITKARLPHLSRLEISDLPSSTDKATAAAVAIIVRRVISQVFFESGWPGVEIFGKEFTKTTTSNNIRLEIKKNEWLDHEIGSRSTVEFAEVYATALDTLYTQIKSALGERLGRNTFSFGLDLIPWEMREVAVEMLARRSAWGEILNQDLADEKELRLELLKRVPIFMSSSPEEVEKLSSIFTTENFNSGEIIVQQGDPGEKFYLLQHGTAEVWVEDQTGKSSRVNLLGQGQFFGETALISDNPRNATIIAQTPVSALSLKKDDFDSLIKERMDVAQTAHNQVRNQWVLRSMPLFDELEAIDLTFLAALLQEEHFSAGDVVIKEGDEGDKFYIVESGELIVTTSVGGKTSELSHRRAGDYFGEIALLEKRPRTATVTAATDTVLLSLGAEDFYDTVPNFLNLKETLETSSSRRLSNVRRTERVLAGT